MDNLGQFSLGSLHCLPNLSKLVNFFSSLLQIIHTVSLRVKLGMQTFVQCTMCTVFVHVCRCKFPQSVTVNNKIVAMSAILRFHPTCLLSLPVDMLVCYPSLSICLSVFPPCRSACLLSFTVLSVKLLSCNFCLSAILLWPLSECPYPFSLLSAGLLSS